MYFLIECRLAQLLGIDDYAITDLLLFFCLKILRQIGLENDLELKYSLIFSRLIKINYYQYVL